jgi:hypothetical protein
VARGGLYAEYFDVQYADRARNGEGA